LTIKFSQDKKFAAFCKFSKNFLIYLFPKTFGEFLSKKV
jgi:hypothetical protein